MFMPIVACNITCTTTCSPSNLIFWCGLPFFPTVVVDHHFGFGIWHHHIITIQSIVYSETMSEFTDMERVSKGVIASISFHFPDEETHYFPVKQALPIDVNDVHPDAKRSNTFYHYSGRHDEGMLPTLHSSGPMIEVLSSVQQIKHISDNFLTERINQLYGYNNSTQNHTDDVHEEVNNDNDGDGNKVKKMRVEAKTQPMEE